ncbi:hypothetical protein MP228_007691 [Amoeboaphelidium protococcarum]|nr:hypothetical protein MP228_007691 [Amoeboaphelidium protococcarum]
MIFTFGLPSAKEIAIKLYAILNIVIFGVLSCAFALGICTYIPYLKQYAVFNEALAPLIIMYSAFVIGTLYAYFPKEDSTEEQHATFHFYMGATLGYLLTHVRVALSYDQEDGLLNKAHLYILIAVHCGYMLINGTMFHEYYWKLFLTASSPSPALSGKLVSSIANNGLAFKDKYADQVLLAYQIVIAIFQYGNVLVLVLALCSVFGLIPRFDINHFALCSWVIAVELMTYFAQRIIDSHLQSGIQWFGAFTMHGYIIYHFLAELIISTVYCGDGEDCVPNMGSGWFPFTLSLLVPSLVLIFTSATFFMLVNWKNFMDLLTDRMIFRLPVNIHDGMIKKSSAA